METQTILKEKSLYETDFYQWALHNAELLRQGKLNEIDIENIVEEIEDLGRNNKRELASRLFVLITHLLKWQYQSDKRSNSWKATLNTQRFEINRLLQSSPSLKYNVEAVIEEEFINARKQFEDETGISKDILPNTCPYTFDQLRDDNFRPE
ncbi:MAG: DUF29 domain-containing protein [Candidatus Magnetoovum sp. WYHC-5]|nr:DUF29 domain-containing protein [Candidatus Magnetoovum sp. WYHC-5]